MQEWQSLLLCHRPYGSAILHWQYRVFNRQRGIPAKSSDAGNPVSFMQPLPQLVPRLLFESNCNPAMPCLCLDCWKGRALKPLLDSVFKLGTVWKPRRYPCRCTVTGWCLATLEAAVYWGVQVCWFDNHDNRWEASPLHHRTGCKGEFFSHTCQ